MIHFPKNSIYIPTNLYLKRFKWRKVTDSGEELYGAITIHCAVGCVVVYDKSHDSHWKLLEEVRLPLPLSICTCKKISTGGFPKISYMYKVESEVSTKPTVDEAMKGRSEWSWLAERHKFSLTTSFLQVATRVSSEYLPWNALRFQLLKVGSCKVCAKLSKLRISSLFRNRFLWWLKNSVVWMLIKWEENCSRLLIYIWCQTSKG